MRVGAAEATKKMGRDKQSGVEIAKNRRKGKECKYKVPVKGKKGGKRKRDETKGI